MKTIIVFKTHVDIGFTDLAKNVLRKYATELLPATVQACVGTQHLGKGKQFVWTMSSYMTKYSLDNSPPGAQEKAKDLAAAGQLAWHCLPFTTHTEFCGLEEFIRGLMISKNLSEAYGHWPVSAKMTDVPGHTWMLPSILAKAGVKFLHLGSNPSVMAPHVPHLFWWEGPDGSRVLCFYSKGLYGSPLSPPPDWPCPVWLALMHTGDNQGPQSADYVKGLLQEADNAVVGTLDDFYNELVKSHLDIPVIKKDLADTWIHGTGTYPKETAALRELRGKITEAEKLFAMGTALGFVNQDDAKAAKKAFAKAYEQCILYGEHTWGMDVKTVLPYDRKYSKKEFLQEKSTSQYKKAEQSWDEQRNRYAIAKEETASALQLFGKPVGDNVLAFNGLGWARDGLPPFGYKVRPKAIATSEAQSTNGQLLENKWFKIKFNPNGTISSLIEKAKNKEWVNQQDPNGFGHYRYDVYGDEDVTEYVRTYSYRFFDWSVNDLGRINYPEQDHLTFYEVGGQSAQEYGNAQEFICNVTLHEDAPIIDISFKLNHKQESPFVEAGHFVFPLNLESPQVALNKMGSVVNIETDIEKGANNALHCLEHFIDIHNGISGMAFIPRHTHLVSVGEQNILKYKPIFEAAEPTLYFNAFNNAYGTNFPQWIGGSFQYEYRLIPHDGDWRQGDVYRKALEFMLPVLEVPVPEAHISDRCSFFGAMEGMAILAFKPVDTGDGFILRVHDITGKPHETTIVFPDMFTKISRCDLQERELETIEGRKYVFETQPFEIHSFCVQKKATKTRLKS